MKDEEKKNEYPVPSGSTVRTSYILFLIVMIFMLVFCALFLSSASAEASYTAGGGTTGNDTAFSSVSIGAGGINGASTNGSDCVSVGAAAAAKNNGATAVGAHSAANVNYGVALGAYTEAYRQTDDGGYYMPGGASEAEKQAAILHAEAQKERMIKEAEGQAQAVLKVQQATAEGLRMIKEAGADESVLTLKSLEALTKVADGKATKIIIPSEIQGIAGLATSLKEIMTDKPAEQK